MMKKRRILISNLLIILMILTACNKGNSSNEAPILIDPVAVNESYRPVEYGSIGSVTIGNGVIVPAYYCHFWKTSAEISEIKVEIGDYVEEGTVLASANSKMSQEAIDEMQKQITLYNSIQVVLDEKFNTDINKQNYILEGYTKVNDVNNINATNIAIETLKENNKFDKLLTKLRIDSINQQISKEQEIVDNSNLIARNSGYVTYIKNIENSGVVSASENVVIISDYEDCYIELQEGTVNDKLFENYSNVYTKLDGKKEELKEYRYSKEELVAAQSKGMYPNNRLKYVNDNIPMEVGTTIPVFMQKTGNDNVLLIGNDSIYSDDKGDFVYVKKDEGKEVRYIELGVKDTNFSQVLEGVKEGEMVYYTSNSIFPEYYEPYEVKNSDYKVVNETRNYEVIDTKNIVQYSELKGTVSEVLVDGKAYVEKGDLLYKINTNEGSAVLSEMQLEIKNAKENYEAGVLQLDNQITEIKNKIKDYEEGKVIATNSDASSDGTNLYTVEILLCDMSNLEKDKEILRLNYEYTRDGMVKRYDEATKSNDGQGNLNVYAISTGTLSSFNIEKGKAIKKGERVCLIKSDAKRSIAVRSTEEIPINQEVVFSQKDSKEEFRGVVKGSTGSLKESNKVYITTIDNKVYINTSDSTNANGAAMFNEGESVVEPDKIISFYIEMEDDSFYEKDNKYLAKYTNKVLKDVVELPAGMIYKETDKATKEEYYFVWKIKEDELVKQYVKVNIDNIGVESMCIISGVSEGDILAREITN